VSTENMNYRKYLKSKLWKHIRRNVLRRDRWICASCGNKATEVHHISYDPATLKGERLEELMSLCRECHEAVGNDMFGMRRPMKDQRALSREVRDSLKRTGQKAPRLSHYRKAAKLDMAGIRALSQQYAEGRMR
jgi:5-methylcytosine-specific restriction endonuclease McrA